MRPSFFKVLKTTAIAYIVLILSIAFSIVTFIKEEKSLKEKEKLIFESVTKEAVLRVKTRMDAYRQTLYAGAGLFNSSKSVEREEWYRFVKTLRIDENFPGIQGVGFSKIIYPHEKEKHISSIRSEGFSEYTIRPEGERKIYSSIVYLEPFDERNQRAFGYDMMSEEIRQEAMRRAMESGAASASGKVRLMQENNVDEQSGFLIYIPIYREGMPTTDAKERSTAIYGFVYAPFRMKDLMSGVLGSIYKDLSLTIYDGTKEDKNILLASEDPNNKGNTLSQETSIEVDGRTWILHFEPRYAFYDQFETASLVLLLGLLLSFAFFGIIISLLKTKERAQEMAQKITKKLFISEERLRFALEGAGDGIWDWDLTTNRVYFSKRWKEMLGYSDGESVGDLSVWRDNVHPDDIEHTIDAINRHLEGKTPIYTSIHRIKCKDGSYKWFLDRGVACSKDAQGKVTRMVGSHTDITDQKIAEEELKAAKEEAERANAHKSQFLANMSHEIRTPLNAVIGLSEALFDTKLDYKQSDYLHKIYGSSKMLLGIINDILDYSKMEANKLELEQRNFKISDVLAQLRVLFTQSAAAKGLEFYIHLREDVPKIIIGDELRLAQILTNLLSNAIKFTQEGKIILSVSLKNSQESRALINFSLSDTGIGLSQEQIKKLFKPFSQADNSTTRKYGGTGLGLTISQKLVHAMGGELSVESIEGKGSIFSFEIDVEVASWVEHRPALPLKRYKILIVDDEEISRTVLKEMMANFECSIDEASSAKEAFDLIQKEEQRNGYDVIIMDWKMPQMDGKEAIHHINEMLREGKIKNKIASILMIGAHAKEEDDFEGIEVDAFLSKPVTSSTLFDVLNALKSSIIKPTKEYNDKLPDFKGIRVLLVEDNELNQEVATLKLNNAGIEVTAAFNGKEAFDIFSSHPERFDLILMDIQMPVMSGYEATELIRGYDKKIPIVALSAAAMIEDKEKAFRAGMNDHLSKPIDTNALYQAIAKWTNRAFTPSGEISKSDAIVDKGALDLNYLSEMVNSNKDTIRKLLSGFLSKLENEYSNLGMFLKNNDSSASTLLHSLKGLSGNMGAKDLYMLCVEIEKKVKSGVTDLQSEANELNLTIEALKSLLHSAILDYASDEQEHTIDEAEIKKLFKQIQTNLKNNNIVPIVDQNRLLFNLKQKVDSKELEMWKESVEEYEFQTALDIMKKWKL